MKSGVHITPEWRNRLKECLEQMEIIRETHRSILYDVFQGEFGEEETFRDRIAEHFVTRLQETQALVRKYLPLNVHTTLSLRKGVRLKESLDHLNHTLLLVYPFITTQLVEDVDTEEVENLEHIFEQCRAAFKKLY